MKFGTIFLAAALAAAPMSAYAATPKPDLSVGTTVMGNNSKPVGTIATNSNGTVVINTGEHKIPVPASAFGKGKNGPTLNITKTQLDQMYAAELAKAKAKLQAAIVVGAPVVTADSQSLGTIDKIKGDNIVVKNADGKMVTLPNSMLALNSSGTIMARANMADIQAALAAQKSKDASGAAQQQGG